jgi:cytochrome c oxidase subunit III
LERKNLNTQTLNIEQKKVEEVKFTSSLAMTVALVSWSMLFATLFLGYAVYRFSASVWPPMGFEQVSLLNPILSSVIIGLSSWSMILAQKNFFANNVKKFRSMLYVTIFLAIAFMAMQFVLWNILNTQGLYVQSGIFASILHGFTWIHAAHVLLGLFGLLYLLPLTFDSTCSIAKQVRVINIAKFWHFLGIIWFLMFFILFLI